MNNFSKSQIGRDYTCKSHSARPDRAELYRICPSKLSKRELEDLYFALLENNLELKRALNGHQDKIKLLSTKVQRMTATQRNAQGKEMKECCVATKAIVCEQKNSIADLKSANERMAERIRLLNMRLCSAKQFLRRSPCAPPAARCTRCCNAPAASLKNSSMSALQTKRSEGNLKPSASSQFDKDVCVTTRSVETATQEEKPTSDRPCDENKCRTLMEELQQKIVNLEEELSNTHEEYSNRISRLEREVLEVRKENLHVRSERIASEHELQYRTRRNNELMTSLRAAETSCNELTMQLSIEKRKVAELETQLKAASMSSNVAKSIEDHFQNSPSTQLLNDTKPDRDETKLPTSTEDSGYMEANRSQDLADNKGLDKLNDDLMKKISDLESKLDHLKVSTAAELAQEARSNKSLHKALNGINIKEIEDPVVVTDKKKEEVFMAPEKNAVLTNAANEEERMNMGSKSDALVTKCNNVACRGVEPVTSPVAIPWQDVPSTSRNLCTCLEKNGDLNKEESAENVPKATRNDTQSSNSNPDQHNRLQIPGPIPTDGQESNRSFIRKLSIELKTKNTQKFQTRTPYNSVQEIQTNDCTQKSATECISRSCKSTNLKDGCNANKVDISVPTNNKATSSGSKNDAKTQSTVDRATDDRDFDTHSYSKDVPDTYSVKSRDSLQMTRERWSKEPIEQSLHNLYANMEAAGAPAPARERAQDDMSPIQFCESACRVCTCPAARHRAVSVFRTCSGTLRFTTVDTGSAKFRTCDCSATDYTRDACVPRLPAGPTSANEANRERRSSSVRSLSQVLQRTRATSPDNTEHEISSMTDLPSEKDAKSPRAALSPGEDKATTTYTDSYTTPITDYGSLSEGELPPKSTVRRVSVGEKTKIDPVPVESSSQKMEAALQAITEELARCKQLLMTQKQEERSPQPQPPAVAVAATCPRPIALRRATATQSIGDAHSPKCVFTLHIGTVVLSDEAVFKSRSKTLMLTWQFYDQAVAMTRMRAGRVVLFDFSTEYDVKLTDDFLHYMRHEEMPLEICALDQQGEPFASCALPLRDALLNTNRRADMSLALVSGARADAGVGAGAGTKAGAGGDELGVLDLWCMLRAEPRLLPAINRAIAQPSMDITYKRVLAQVQEDEQSVEGSLSQDLDLALAKQSAAGSRRTSTRRGSQTASEVPRRTSSLSITRIAPIRNAATTAVTTSTNAATTAIAAATTAAQTAIASAAAAAPTATTATNATTASTTATATPNGMVYDASKYPEMRHNSVQLSKLQLKPVTERKSSGIIVNEVEASIKSPYDMKQAVDRKLSQNLHGFSRPKNEDEINDIRASATSLKNIVAKLTKPHRDLKKEISELRDSDSIGHRKRASRISILDLPPPKSFTENEIDTEISRKYENMFKNIGSNKPETSKKSVKIYPRHPDSDPMTEEPQRDTSGETGSQSQSQTQSQSVSITVLWLALNEECEAMVSPHVQRLYVAYSFLGRSGADLETPVSLPKPKHYVDKCHFNFKKTFQLEDVDLPLVGHMARCRAAGRAAADPNDCIVFSVVSEPPEDPLGLDNCEDIGYAYLYLGDLLAYSAGSPEYTEVTPVRAARGAAAVCGVLAVRVQGLHVVRRCLALAAEQRDLSADIWTA